MTSHTDFIRRHVGVDEKQQESLLGELGYTSLEDFLNNCVPDSILAKTSFDLGEAVNERHTLAEIARMGEKNRPCKYMIGCGYADTFLPPVIQRNFVENPGWYTAYTPYQSEISQGRLQLMLNFQQMVIELTGLDVANASLLDEATAAAEAAMLAYRAINKKKKTILVDIDCHPQTRAVIHTRCQPLGLRVLDIDTTTELPQESDACALVVTYPGTSGQIRDYSEVFSKAKEQGICTIIAADPMALVLLKTPAQMGADIAVGCTQRFGVPLGFGGPHAGYIACRDTYKRHLPGRIIGISHDVNGTIALRMALQTREQHIRREKATSNICTAQVLLANLSALYAQYHGPDGLTDIAATIHTQAKVIAQACAKAGMDVVHEHFFDTVCLRSDDGHAALYDKALDAGYCLRKNGDLLQISCNETTDTHDVQQLVKIITGQDITAEQITAHRALPKAMQRATSPLRHPVFTSIHSETDMMRYLKAHEDKDIALNRSMIALGSCTMKLNAVAEMMPVTWPSFAQVHPFAPKQLCLGHLELINSLEQFLCTLTGFSKVSMQPNSGAQGEYAGLSAIRGYHRSRADENRNTCLIPSSAHGTNPASAHMAGMNVVVVDCDSNGNVDMQDMQNKVEKHKDTLAALMITYPSTHGIFEKTIQRICDLIHQNGGLVYMDGANMNAMVGIIKPAELGADVMHLNLHKTFCIPHGGGGPGAGPIGVVDRLVPFLPSHPHIGEDSPTISAAPYGSALILPISWAYIRMMGRQGLRRATSIALLNANYIAKRLQQYYPILYTAENGLVAHECIIDLRPLKQETKISEEDIAKRLIDYGFHAPTMSFPVAGTLMIEPTESESKAELDRFCEAMIMIRKEIDKVKQGKWPLEDNPLVNAPHTASEICADWQHPYTREEACYPLEWIKQWKYWPPVKRVDNVSGDKNFIGCMPLETELE